MQKKKSNAIRKRRKSSDEANISVGQISHKNKEKVNRLGISMEPINNDNNEIAKVNVRNGKVLWSFQVYFVYVTSDLVAVSQRDVYTWKQHINNIFIG